MTPVEERIDHEAEAQARIERWEYEAKREPLAVAVAMVLLENERDALLTEHSAREKVVEAAYIAKHEGRYEPLHDALHALDERCGPPETGDLSTREASGEGNGPAEGAAGYVFAEGDARCGAVHREAKATCLLPRGHEGDHRNTQGYWRPRPDEFDAQPEEETDATLSPVEGDKGWWQR